MRDVYCARVYNNGLVRADHNDVEPFAAPAIRANQRAPRCVIPSNAIYASSGWHDPIQPSTGYTFHITIPSIALSSLLEPRECIRSHHAASQPLCPSVRIADRLPITRIVLITAAETYRPILITIVAANGRDSTPRVQRDIIVDIGKVLSITLLARNVETYCSAYYSDR